MFTETELHSIKLYEAEGIRKEIDDSPLDLDPFAVRTFKRMRQSGHVIDIGCGHGRIVPLLADMCIARECYKGIDPSLSQVALAKELHPGLDFEVGDIYSLSDTYPSYFDGFWCSMMLMHIPRNRLAEALDSLRQSLKQNAVGIIATPCGVGVKCDEDGMEFTLYQTSELQAALEQTGFRSSFYNPIPQIQVGSIVAV